MLELRINPIVNNPCPICGNVGQKVKKVTVEHQVKNNIAVYGGQFFLCRTPECGVGYYSEDGNVISQEQLINKIWFKGNISSPIPICYCANVTKEEILRHVAVRQCCSTLDDLKSHTGATTGCKCTTMNPAGT